MVKLHDGEIPAALLAVSLSQTRGEDDGRLGVKLTNLMPAVVVFSKGKIGITPFNLTSRGVHQTGFQ